VTTQVTNVTDPSSVSALAALAESCGPVTAVVHTAGVSPTQADARTVVDVDLVGVARSLDAFGQVVSPGGAGVVIASMAGHLRPPLSAEDEMAIGSASPGDLSSLDVVRAASEGAAGPAYGFAKRAATVLVAAASVTWGLRGARVNSISPGIISTPMGQAELSSQSGEFMRTMIDASAARRAGTPDEIAAAAEFLLSQGASFITGTDVLADGGVVAAMRRAAAS
jgi:NAD(P)-dependent dehydrogenase (short-subunit alcohol dehydrogenase family)